MRLAERHRDDGDWRAFCRGLSPRLLTEWLLLEEDEVRGEERADLRTALLVEAFTGKPVAETLRFIDEYTTLVLDVDDLVTRKQGAKAVRVKRAKAKMSGNIVAAKALQAQTNGKQQHRTMERPGNA
jgi:hypothetical protein